MTPNFRGLETQFITSQSSGGWQGSAWWFLPEVSHAAAVRWPLGLGHQGLGGAYCARRLMHTAGRQRGVQVRLAPGVLTHGSTHRLDFAQHGRWVARGSIPRPSVSRGLCRSYKASDDLVSQFQNVPSATFCWPRKSLRLAQIHRRGSTLHLWYEQEYMCGGRADWWWPSLQTSYHGYSLPFQSFRKDCGVTARMQWERRSMVSNSFWKFWAEAGHLVVVAGLL